MSVRTLPAKLTATVLCVAASGAWATEYGTVLSSTPVLVSVPVVQRQCVDEQVIYQQPNTGAGALLGAIAGGAVGNSIGGGAGRAAATGIGLILGAQIGDRVEAGGLPQGVSTVQNCRNVTAYERRVVGYDVLYEYQGMRRTARLPQDPGPQIAREVNVAPAGGQQPAYVVAVPPPPPPQPDHDGSGQPRVVYAAPQQMVVNPLPLLLIGAGLYGAWNGWGGGHGGYHGHRR